MLFYRLLASSLAFAAPILNGWSQDVELSPIVVSDSPGTNADTISQSTVPGKDWDARGGNVESALAPIPGLSFSANGGPGQPRALFLRGAAGDQTLVLVDGMPVNDPSSPSRAFDFSQIPAGELARVNVKKGPQGVLYGGDALAGVVEFISKPDDGLTHARIEAGSYGTASARANAKGFFVSAQRSDGFSAADSVYGNSERDGYRSMQAGVNKEFALSKSNSLRIQGGYRHAVIDSDKDGGPNGDSFGTRAVNNQISLRGEAAHSFSPETESTLSLAHFEQDREDNSYGMDRYHGRLWLMENRWQHRAGAQEFQFGGALKQENSRSNQQTKSGEFFTASLFAQDTFRFDKWELEAGARVDRNAAFPTAFTYRAGLAYLFAESWKARASYGTGFKPPSLFQLYATSGNLNLRPQRSGGIEAGVEFHTNDWDAEATLFQTRYQDLVDYLSTPSPGRYYNIGRAETHGLELGISRHLGIFTLQNAFTYLVARDLVKHAALARRPTFTDVLSANIDAKQIGGGISFRYVGRRPDVDPVQYTVQPMPAFLVAGGNAWWQMSPVYRLTGRVDNLFNRHYQETSGYGVAGLSGYIGVEAAL